MATSAGLSCICLLYSVGKLNLSRDVVEDFCYSYVNSLVSENLGSIPNQYYLKRLFNIYLFNNCFHSVILFKCLKNTGISE